MNRKQFIALLTSGRKAIPYIEQILDIQPDNLVGYYPMNEASLSTMVDAGEFLNNGAYSAGMKINNAIGPDGINNCPLFDASGYCSPYSAKLNTDIGNKQEVTLAIWFKPLNVGVWGDGDTRILFQLYTDGSNNIRIEKTSTANRLTMYYVAGGTTKQVNIATTAPGGWNVFSISASKSSDQVRCFVNGQRVGDIQTSLGTWAGNLLGIRTNIGSFDQVPSSPTSGWLAHAMIWKSPLTDAEHLRLASIHDGELSHSNTLANMPATVEQAGSDILNGLIYSVGGIRSVEINEVYAYDPITNLWATKAVLPISVQSPIVRTVGNRLYCIGGLENAVGVYPDCYEYNPDTDAWTKKADMPTAREDMGSAVVGTKIYVFGGLGPPSTPTKVLEIYDTETDTWTTGADMPDFKMLGDFGVSYNGLVYAMGSTNSFVDYPSITPTADCYVYNPQTNVWSAIAAHPEPRCYSELVVRSGKIYQLGGATTSTTTYINTIYRYDPVANSWSLVGRSPIAARGCALAVDGDNIYISGGFTGSAVNSMFVVR